MSSEIRWGDLGRPIQVPVSPFEVPYTTCERWQHGSEPNSSGQRFSDLSREEREKILALELQKAQQQRANHLVDLRRMTYTEYANRSRQVAEEIKAAILKVSPGKSLDQVVQLPNPADEQTWQLLGQGEAIVDTGYGNEFAIEIEGRKYIIPDEIVRWLTAPDKQEGGKVIFKGPLDARPGGSREFLQLAELVGYLRNTLYGKNEDWRKPLGPDHRGPRQTLEEYRALLHDREESELLEPNTWTIFKPERQ